MSASSDKSTMIRILGCDKEFLRKLAQERGDTMLNTLHQLVEEYKVRSFLEGLRSDYAALAANPALVKEEHEENELLDGMSFDGLEDE
jgi:hypothetical protein